jgi:hypothetical protein
MSWMLASWHYVPFLVASCVLSGFALGGWRRSGATGALLVASGAGVRVLHQLFGVYSTYQLYAQGPSRAEYLQRAALYGAFQTVGAILADVLVIVGVALLLRRLPARVR